MLKCFGEAARLMAAEQCMAGAGERAADPVDSLTDGVLCLQDMTQNVSFQIFKLFEKDIKKDFERFKKFAEENKDKKKTPPPPPGPGTDLVSKRHCEIAAPSEAAAAACLQCFEAARPEAGQEAGQRPSRAEYYSSLAACSATHLSPQYDRCTALLAGLATAELPDDKEPSINIHGMEALYRIF